MHITKKTIFNKPVFLILILVFIFFSNSFSQDSCGYLSLNDAKKYYEFGNFNNVIQTLMPCIERGFSIDQKVQAYKLLSLTYLALDSTEIAYKSASSILKLNPNFEANLFDPPKFIQMINEIKKTGSSLQVTSVSKKSENLYEAPATVILVTEDDFTKRGYNDIEMMLHDLPGFDISRSNGNLYSHVYQRGYRSINTNRTLFLIDGIEDNDLWSSNVYLSRQFSLSNLKNVEVVYGPASTMYGANAFLGVVNVITKKPEDIIPNGEQLGVCAQAGYGSYNTKFFDATIAAKTKKEKISFMLTGRVFYSDEHDLSGYSGYDYEPLAFTDELADIYKSKLGISGKEDVLGFLASNPYSHPYYSTNNDSSEISLTNAGAQRAFELDNKVFEDASFSDKAKDVSINAKLQLYDFTLGWFYWKKAEGPGVQYDNTDYGGADQGQQWAPIHNCFYVKYDKDINSKLNISNFLRYKLHKFDENNRIVRFRNYRYSTGRKYDLSNLVAEDIPTWDSTYLFQTSNQLRNELKILYTPTSKLDIILGSEIRFSSIQGDYLISTTNDAEETGFPGTDIDGGNHFSSRDIGIYAQSSYKILSNLKLTAGLRFDNNKIRIDEGYGNVFNPRIAVVYTPGKFIVKVNYATAFKDATNREKYSTAKGKRELPNPDLEPEKVKNFEMEIGRFLKEKFYVNVVGFRSDYSNIIQEIQVDYNGGFTNQNKAIGVQEVWGVHSTANYKIKNFQFYANYTYTNAKNIDPVDSDNNPLLDDDGIAINELCVGDIADHQINFGVNYFYKEKLNINIRMNYVGERKVGEGTTVPDNPETFDPYAVFFGTISYEFKTLGLTLQCVVNNIFDLEYYSPGLDMAVSPNSSGLIQNGRNVYVKLLYNL